MAMSIAPDPEDLFFAEPAASEAHTLVEETSERARHVSLAATRSGHSRFLPMVKMVVTACAALVFAVGIRSAVAHSHRDDRASKKSVDVANSYAAASAPMPANMAGLAIAATSSEAAALTVDAAASRAKANESQAKLEHGAVTASIELGEEAVKLDAASARAWLILGAAYQQRGDIKNAWRCYHTCVDQGEGIDRAECASML